MLLCSSCSNRQVDTESLNRIMPVGFWKQKKLTLYGSRTVVTKNKLTAIYGKVDYKVVHWGVGRGSS